MNMQLILPIIIGAPILLVIGLLFIGVLMAPMLSSEISQRSNDN